MSNRSYRKYRQYRANKHGYKMEQIAAPLLVMLVMSWLGDWFIPILILSIVLVIINFFITRKDKHVAKATQKGETQEIVLEVKTVQDKELISLKKTTDIVNVVEEDKSMKQEQKKKTTEKGYVNRNQQENLGRTSEPGTDHCQWFYQMKCLHCGHLYKANGTDIFQRKCPKCQGGRP